MRRVLPSGQPPQLGKSTFHPSLRFRAIAPCRPKNHLVSGSRLFSLDYGASKPSGRSARRLARSDIEGISLEAPAFQVPNDEDLTFSEALKTGTLEILYQHRKKRSKPHERYVKYPAVGDSAYGKWQYLTFDEQKMREESDIKASLSTNLRLIDQPGNESDIQLWGCLLEFCHRRMGYEGVVMLWQSVLKKRTLRQVDGPLAQAFWARILGAAVTNHAFLREVVDYGRWLYQQHGVQWPKLYSTVMNHMLSHGDRDEVLQWHITLDSLYPIDEAEVTALMMDHITIPDPKVQQSLQLLYKYGRHHTMYDLIIPFLYSQGHDFLARQWRKVFLLVNDYPVSSASRPFLRYLMAYYSRNMRFRDEEIAVASTAPVDRIGAPGHELSTVSTTGQNLSYLVNRVHGETFGIHEKPYNDSLGAKWLASTWVSLDFAISVLHTLGVEEIGPMSLRAIAWRERLARRLRSRLGQLTQFNIRIAESNYVRALRYYASIDDDEALQEFVSSDIHPDVFDNEEALPEVLANCVREGDWITYRLILTTIIAGSSDQLRIKSNQVLESCLRQGNGQMALRIMQELRSENIGLLPSASDLVSRFVVQHLSPHRENSEPTQKMRDIVNLHWSLCRELAYTRFPPAVGAWRTILFRLGREGRLHDLERQCLDIVRMYFSYQRSPDPMWACAKVDLPPELRTDSPNEQFHELPRDIGLQREDHPLRLIFDRNMQNSIVRWGFQYTPYSSYSEVRATAILNKDDPTPTDPVKRRKDNTPPVEYHFARGIRLIAMLRDRGIFYQQGTIKKQVTLRLIDLYRGEGRVEYEWVGGNRQIKQRRRKNRLNLAEAKRLCDKAWGEEDMITPSLFELESTINKVEVRDNVMSPPHMSSC